MTRLKYQLIDFIFVISTIVCVISVCGSVTSVQVDVAVENRTGDHRAACSGDGGCGNRSRCRNRAFCGRGRLIGCRGGCDVTGCLCRCSRGVCCCCRGLLCRCGGRSDRLGIFAAVDLAYHDAAANSGHINGAEGVHIADNIVTVAGTAVQVVLVDEYPGLAAVGRAIDMVR